MFCRLASILAIAGCIILRIWFCASYLCVRAYNGDAPASRNKSGGSRRQPLGSLMRVNDWCFHCKCRSCKNGMPHLFAHPWDCYLPAQPTASLRATLQYTMRRRADGLTSTVVFCKRPSVTHARMRALIWHSLAHYSKPKAERDVLGTGKYKYRARSCRGSSAAASRRDERADSLAHCCATGKLEGNVDENTLYNKSWKTLEDCNGFMICYRRISSCLIFRPKAAARIALAGSSQDLVRIPCRKLENRL